MSARNSLILFAWLLALPCPAEARQARSGAVLRQFQAERPCPSTGLKTGSCPGYVKDHLTPLCLDPSGDRIENLQWQTVADAKAKDKLEWAVCRAKRRKGPMRGQPKP